jgi:hypothetical protein
LPVAHVGPHPSVPARCYNTSRLNRTRARCCLVTALATRGHAAAPPPAISTRRPCSATSTCAESLHDVNPHRSSSCHTYSTPSTARAPDTFLPQHSTANDCRSSPPRRSPRAARPLPWSTFYDELFPSPTPKSGSSPRRPPPRLVSPPSTPLVHWNLPEPPPPRAMVLPPLLLQWAASPWRPPAHQDGLGRAIGQKRPKCTVDFHNF